MDLSTSILGTTTAQYLRLRQQQPVLTIGSDRYTRSQLASVGCFNFIAAARVSQSLREAIRVKHTRDLFDRIPPEALVLPQLGPVALAVLGAVFELAGLGGDVPLETWVKQHRDGHTITFGALKASNLRARRKQEQTRKAARKRTIPQPRQLPQKGTAINGRA